MTLDIVAVGSPSSSAMAAALAAGFVATVILMPVAILVLRRLSVHDVPNHRSLHTRVTPRGAGFGICAALLVGFAFHGHSREGLIIVALGVLCCALGGTDDVRSLPPVLRLLLLVLLAGFAMLALREWAHLDGAPLVFVLGVVWIVGFVNVFNFMDGVNGISGTNAALVSGWYAWLAYRAPDSTVTLLALLLAASAVGFLLFNAPRALIFLGDSGSYLIGALVAVFGVVLYIEDVQPWRIAAPIAIYLVDTSSTLVRRGLRGESVLSAHKEHRYQKLAQSGWSHTAVALWSASLAVVCCGCSLASPVWAIPALVIVCVGYLTIPRLTKEA